MRCFTNLIFNSNTNSKQMRKPFWLVFGLCSLLTLLLIVPPLPGQAAGPDGSVDTTFLTGGGPSRYVRNIIEQSDGKIIIGGDFTASSTLDITGHRFITRLNSDSTLDTTFNPGGIGAGGAIYATVLQNDGKILIGGTFTSYNGTDRNRIARLNSDGTLDTTFNPGTGANNVIFTTAPQNDGKILIGGTFTSYNGTGRNRIARLNSDGTLDTTFNPGTGANGEVSRLLIQSDGKILLGGQFTAYNGTTRGRLARLNTDGTLDTAFNPGGAGANNNIFALALQNDGKILLGGQFTTFDGTAQGFIARLNSDGTLDSSFNSGSGAAGFVHSIVVQSDSKILVGGVFGSYNGVTQRSIIRLNSDGTADGSINSGTGADNSINVLTVQSNGNILIGGFFTAYNGVARTYLARLSSTGTLETTFNPGYGLNGYVYAMALQNNDKVVAGGLFAGSVTLLNTDGSPDATFNPGTGASDTVVALATQNDGKILVGGFFTSFSGTARGRIVRLNTNGSIDTTFNPGTGANNAVQAIKVQSDGKILIGGAFTSYNGTARNYIARLNPDGSLDTTFDPGTGANNTVLGIGVQSDGKILLGGNFTSLNGTARNYIARINNDGTLDTTFNPGSGADEAVRDLAIQNDGKIVLVGSFVTYNGTAHRGVARVNSDGTLDTTFNPGSGFGSFARAVVLQNDGKIIVGGAFNSYNGVVRNYIARINPDGGLDTTFNPGSGASSTVYRVALESTGKLVIAGLFNAVDKYTRFGIARLEAKSLLPSSTALTASPNPATFGSSVTFTATLTPLTATGSVQFAFGGSVNKTVTGTLVNGVATYITSTLPVGATPLTANYTGDADLFPSSSVVYTQTINKAASNITVTSAPNPATFGQTATFTATVLPSGATGTVTFTIGVANVTALLSNGVATYVTDTLAVGSYSVTASYSGNTNYNGSTTGNGYTHVVVAACNPLVITITSDNGQATSCGTFSYALTVATSGTTISFALTNTTTITFSGSLTPTVAAGVTIEGGPNGITLEGNGVTGDGLRLGGSNILSNLTIRRFAGRELIASSGNNQLYKIRLAN